MKPYWSTIDTVLEAIANLTFEHYGEHIPDVEAWVGKKKADPQTA